MQKPAMAVAGIALAMLAGTAAIALAQERFPARPIQMIVPATPGGPVDTAARMIEPALSSALSASVVLINRPGASGTLGMQEVATAEPSGYTIGQGINSIFTITRISGTSVPFALDSFTLLGNYATDVSVLAVSADAPWKTLDDVIAYVHANPGKLNYASAGIGTVSSLSMQALAHQFQMDMVAVPFPGGAQLTTAILGKQIDIGMVPYTTGAGMFASNKLRPLITTAPTRLPQLPEVPTFVERGIVENGLNLVMGLYAPKGLPDGVRNVLVDAIAKATHDASFAAKVEAIGLLARYEDPAAARKRLETEYADIAALSHKLEK
jgi:tripartite-type tricarboxylate transporter receptor subunit TctC